MDTKELFVRLIQSGVTSLYHCPILPSQSPISVNSTNLSPVTQGTQLSNLHSFLSSLLIQTIKRSYHPCLWNSHLSFMHSYILNQTLHISYPDHCERVQPLIQVILNTLPCHQTPCWNWEVALPKSWIWPHWSSGYSRLDNSTKS